MNTRKIQLVGKRSYAITLPKSWIAENKLAPSDKLFIEKTANNELLIKSVKKISDKGSKVSIELSKIREIAGFLHFCYVKNIDTIVIHAKHFDIQSIRKIKQGVKHIEGYGITSETPTAVEVSFLYHDIDVRIERVMRRTLYLLKVMFESVKVKDYETLTEIEDSIDKLYLLAKRVLLRCQKNSQVRNDNDITGPEDVLFLWIIFKKMENIADSFERINKDDSITSTEAMYIDKMLKLIEKAIYRPSIAGELVLEIKEQVGKKTNRTRLIVYIYKEAIDILQNVDYIQMNKTFFKEGEWFYFLFLFFCDFLIMMHYILLEK